MNDVIITKETSCFNNLRWRIFLETKIPFEQFVDSMIEIGYTEINHPLFPKVIEIKHRTGHHIIFIPKTNRIQLKLDIDSNQDNRVINAFKIAKSVTDALIQFPNYRRNLL